MTESIIQAEPFPKDFCMFDIIVVKIDSNTSSMSLFVQKRQNIPNRGRHGDVFNEIIY